MKKSSQQKARWATRFTSNGHKSQKKPGGPQTHRGPVPKIVAVHNAAYNVAPADTVLTGEVVAVEDDETEDTAVPSGMVLGGVIETGTIPDVGDVVIVAPPQVVEMDDGSGGLANVEMVEKEPVVVDTGFG